MDGLVQHCVKKHRKNYNESGSDNSHLNRYNDSGCFRHSSMYSRLMQIYQNNRYHSSLRPLWPLHSVPPTDLPDEMSLAANIPESMISRNIIETNIRCMTMGIRSSDNSLSMALPFPGDASALSSVNRFLGCWLVVIGVFLYLFRYRLTTRFYKLYERNFCT